MNKQLAKFARDTLKRGLFMCTDEECLRFKRMYSHNDLTSSINKVVDNMEDDSLDWAMQQVQNSLDKRERTNVRL